MKVIRNTYPVWPKCAHAEVGDVVEWQSFRTQLCLVRKSDGAAVFSRDHLPKHIEDTRPVCGLIASVKSKGWYLEISN